jgi:hypothetical protein
MGPTYAGLKQKRKETYLSESIAEINAEIGRRSPNYVTLQAEPCFDDVRPFQWQNYQAGVSYDYAIDLARPLKEMWGGFDATCRKQIGHGEARGVLPFKAKFNPRLQPRFIVSRRDALGAVAEWTFVHLVKA